MRIGNDIAVVAELREKYIALLVTLYLRFDSILPNTGVEMLLSTASHRPGTLHYALLRKHGRQSPRKEFSLLVVIPAATLTALIILLLLPCMMMIGYSFR